MSASWDNLRFFVALARAGTTRGAASALHVSETTVRRRLDALEAQLGVTMFEHVDGTYVLSAGGRLLMPDAEAMEQTVDRIRETAHGGSSQPAGHVRVGAADGFGCICVAPLLARLQERLPDLTIELITLSRTADLTRREVDVAVVGIRPEAGGDHRIRSLPPLSLRLYASERYLSTHPPIRSAACLATHRIVGFSEYSGFGEPMRRAALAVGLGPAPSIVFSSIIAQARAAAAGAGVALLPSYAAEPHLNLVPVLHGEVSTEVPVWLMVHAEMASLPRVRAVTEAIASLFPIDR